MVQDAPLHRPRDIEIGVIEALQLIERPDHISGIEAFGVNHARVGGGEGSRRRREEVRRRIDLGARQHTAIAVEKVDGGKPAQRRLHGQELAEADRILLQLRRGVVQILGHQRDVVADEVHLRLDVGPGDRRRVFDHRGDAMAEPAVDALVDQHPKDDGHHDRRGHGRGREHRDEPQVQARTGIAPLGHDQAEDAAARHECEAADQDEVQAQNDQDGLAWRPDRAGHRR